MISWLLAKYGKISYKAWGETVVVSYPTNDCKNFKFEVLRPQQYFMAILRNQPDEPVPEMIKCQPTLSAASFFLDNPGELAKMNRAY